MPFPSSLTLLSIPLPRTWKRLKRSEPGPATSIPPRCGHPLHLKQCRRLEWEEKSLSPIQPLRHTPLRSLESVSLLMGYHAKSQPRPPNNRGPGQGQMQRQGWRTPHPGKGGPKGGSKGDSKGGKGDPKGKGNTGKRKHSPPFRPNWQPNGEPEPPEVISKAQVQSLWNGTCAADKCVRWHDGRGWERTKQKDCIFCSSCTEHLVAKSWKGLWCKDNNQRNAFGRLTQRGEIRQARPPKAKAHQANSAYITIEDDDGGARQQPVPNGTWERDRTAPGGWSFVPGAVRQVVQAEATDADPYGRAYMAEPYQHAGPQYAILEDSPTGPLTPPLPPYDPSIVNPDMDGTANPDDMLTYDSDDYGPQVHHTPGAEPTYPNPDWDIPISDHIRALTASNAQALTSGPEQDDNPVDQNGWSKTDWDEWNYQMGTSRPPPATLERQLTWVSGAGGGYPQDIYTVTQQSDVEPSIPLLRIGQGPAPRYSAPIPPQRGVHVDNTPSLHPIPKVTPKHPKRVSFQDPVNYEEIPFERPGGYSP